MPKKKIVKEKTAKTVKAVAKKVKTIAKPAIEKALEILEPEVKSFWQRFKDWLLRF